MSTKTCQGCGAEIVWDITSSPEPIGEHCGECPPWTCPDCGCLDSYGTEGPHCACWVSLDDLPLADIKGIFAADGTFNVNADGALSA